MEFTREEVALYFEAFLGHKPLPGADGMLRLPCTWPFPVRPPHDVLINPNSGRWRCEGDHGGGDLADLERGRSRISDHRQAEQAVLKIIREAKERKRQAEEAIRAARDKQVEDLPAPVRSLLRIIDRHPEGIARRDLQQQSHMRRAEFRKGLKELEGRGLIRSQQVPSRLKRRPTVVYFPVVDTKPASGDEACVPGNPPACESSRVAFKADLAD